jgi:lambda family phage portal protein
MKRRGRNTKQIINDQTVSECFGAIKADYNAGKQSRFRRQLTGVSPMGSGADYHYRNEWEFLRMMEQARETDRNDIVVPQAITRLVDNVLQGGIQVEPQTGNKDVDQHLFKKWVDWGKDPEQCHNEGEHDFNSLAKLALRHVVVDGDCVFLPLKTGRLQAIEAHRIRTPNRTTKNVVLGVLLSETRRRLEYWVTRDNLSPHNAVTKVSQIKPFKVRDKDGNRILFHVYNPKRLSQTRGVTALAPPSDAIGIHDDIQFAQLIKQQTASCFAIFRERELDYRSGEVPASYGETETESLDDGTTRTLEGIGPGMDVTGAPGEKLTGFSPSIPNAEFFDHAKLILTFIAINLNLPVAVLLLDPSDTNFSGWRGAMDQARIGFRNIQSWMVDRFYEPTYAWKVRSWLNTDVELQKLLALNPTADVFNHSWNPPHWAYIEPFKDARADSHIVDNNLNSRRAVLARRGLDIDKVDKIQINDNGALIRMALKEANAINGEFSEANLDWREIINLKTSASVKKETEKK